MMGESHRAGFVITASIWLEADMAGLVPVHGTDDDFGTVGKATCTLSIQIWHSWLFDSMSFWPMDVGDQFPFNDAGVCNGTIYACPLPCTKICVLFGCGVHSPN